MSHNRRLNACNWKGYKTSFRRSSHIFVNDLQAAADSSKPFLFADDTKLLKVILQPLDHLLLQKDLTPFTTGV